MEGYIDIHSHILPHLDDGAENIEESIGMLKVAYEEGIRTIITTPHYHEVRYPLSLSQMQDSLKCVQEKIKDIYPELQVNIGCEIYYSHGCVKLLNEKCIPTLADSRYVLVEFSPSAEYGYMKKGLQEFLYEGYCPILAHVERYDALIKQSLRVKELNNMGVCIQLNARSILGKSGRTYRKLSRKLLRSNLVHFIATDSHNKSTRAPNMRKCVHYITKKYGIDVARKLFVDNPQKILTNESLNP